MATLKLRRRHRLRRKEVEALASAMSEMLGCGTFSREDMLETAEAGERKLLLLAGKPVAMEIAGEFFPTVHGLLLFSPARRYVTVDMGAVRFLANGADVMAPGIVDADPDISTGMAVWVRDERNLRPLLVGQALMDAADMVAGSSGKAIKTLHYVGDRIWALGE